VERTLSRRLHKLTARLDAAADSFLRDEAGLSYRRFLALYMVGSEGADTQRTLAERLGVSEPSVSRMVHLLAEAGLLQTASAPGGGNRNRLSLTAAGEQLVQRWGGELERRLASLVEAATVPYGSYLDHTNLLLEALEASSAGAGEAQRASGAKPTAKTAALA
jgi:DNA-binding MarR family transcriptional regulator